MSTDFSLGITDIRVLGVLIEKQRTVPDTYPLSINALLSGCNQKTSREPVMELSEADVAQSLDHMRGLSLIIESSGGRVSRYGHNIERVLGIPTQSSAILAALMLRGPQTAGELRINCERLHRFADISALEGFLHELRDRNSGALVQELPRQPGSRENRWIHTLCPELVETYNSNLTAAQAPSPWPNEIGAIRQDLEALRAEVAALRAQLCLLTQAPEKD